MVIDKAKFVDIISELGDDFYDVVSPASFPKQQLRFVNERWAGRLGLEFTNKEWLKHFAQFKPFDGSLEKALALRYHGHQFRHYNPNIGDGRGFLFAQLKWGSKYFDFGTKGSGQTPYSRRGDGRLTLKGAVREVLAAEYLEAHKVNTSKCFAVIETGEDLFRHDEPSPTRSAVLTRLNHSHIRIGTFQRLAYFNEDQNLLKLLDYSCKYYYPEIQNLETKAKIKAFLSMVTSACAKTCAEWMMSGYVHGVLNSDNINITGESFDYGPYRLLPYYDPHFTAAYFDDSGLYSYGRQAEAISWNLQQLALCFHSFFDDPKEAIGALSNYPKDFSTALMDLFFNRLQLKPKNQVENNKLFTLTFAFMESSKVPFEDFFFDWAGGMERSHKAMTGERASYYKGEDFNAFYKHIKSFSLREDSILAEDYFQRDSSESLLIDEIESIWQAIDKNDDWSGFDNKIKALRSKKVF